MDPNAFNSTRRSPAAAKPDFIFLIGSSGSGKTMVGSAAAAELGWNLIDTDDEILRQSDYSTISELFEAKGEAAFRTLELLLIQSLTTDSGPAVVATGGGLPAQDGMMARLNSIGTTIYLRARAETLWDRLLFDPKGIADRPLLAAGKSALEELDTRRRPIYNQATLILDTDALDAAAVARHVVAQAE